MTTLLNRFRKLETRLTDASGLAPYSRAWLDYWKQRIEKLLAGERTGRIPLEAIEGLVAAGRAEIARAKLTEMDLTRGGG